MIAEMDHRKRASAISAAIRSEQTERRIEAEHDQIEARTALVRNGHRRLGRNLHTEELNELFGPEPGSPRK